MSTWMKLLRGFSKDATEKGPCEQTGILRAENISLTFPLLFLFPNGIIRFSERGFDNSGTLQFLSILFEIEN